MNICQQISIDMNNCGLDCAFSSLGVMINVICHTYPFIIALISFAIGLYVGKKLRR